MRVLRNLATVECGHYKKKINKRIKYVFLRGSLRLRVIRKLGRAECRHFLQGSLRFRVPGKGGRAECMHVLRGLPKPEGS